MKEAIFFITTPKCATQWFQNVLGTIYGENGIVNHDWYPDKLQNLYRQENCVISKFVETKTTEVNNLFKSLDKYVETGFPSFILIPHYIAKLKCEKIKLIHVVRNPISYLISISIHSWLYNKTPQLSGKNWFPNAFLRPEDNLIYKNIFNVKSWDSLSVQQRRIMLWMEIRTYAKELQETYKDNKKVDFLTIRFEDFFENQNDTSLLDFLQIYSRRDRKIFYNSFAKPQGVTSSKIERNFNLDDSIRNFTELKTLAKEFGYEIL